MNEFIYNKAKIDASTDLRKQLLEWDLPTIYRECWVRSLPKEECLAYAHLGGYDSITYYDVVQRYKVSDDFHHKMRQL